MSDLLKNLNQEQYAAVTLPNQSALILAGAGSGKTRVLTTRIAWLIQTGQASPATILAVTFTNKAAKEMTARLMAMLPINLRGMWIGTFHGLCNRFLRAHHQEAGLPAMFQILDSSDQLSAIKRLLKALNVDDEKHPAKEVMYFINGNKDAGLRAQHVEADDDFGRKRVELYRAYDEQCQREGVVDFAELLLRTYEMLVRNELLREHYQSRFKHILVDEFQDTNVLQYKWLKLLAGAGLGGVSPAQSNPMFAVGDDDQCVIKGTRVTLPDGKVKPIERLKVGDEVMSCHGKGVFRASRVAKVHQHIAKTGLIQIDLASGRRLTSTAEHLHFADYLLGETPQVYFTYLMHKRGTGYRLGTTQVHTKGQVKSVVGFRQRSAQEHADALWIVGVHESENEARTDEILLSLRFGLPTLPFVPRKGGSKNGLVHDGKLIQRVFREIDTAAAAARLMAERGLRLDEPHFVPRARNANRRNIGVTLCGDPRGATTLHRISVAGNDAEGAAILRKMGLSVRAAKKASHSWRYETAFKDYGEIMRIATAIRAKLGGVIQLRAGIHTTPMRSLRADMVRQGMMMMGGDGKLDAVVAVKTIKPASTLVYDIDVEHTHNFIANGIVTHNSIYAFRGARVGNMHDFERDFHVQNLIKLEQNYRSHGHILDAANALIKNNPQRLGKNLWTDAGHGEPVRVYEAQTDLLEARWLISEIKSLINDGSKRSEIALLYRSNAQSRVIEQMLFAEGIPYKVYGGLRFFERAEVKHAIAYLRLLANPDDDTSYARVVNFPARGIGARSLEQLSDAARTRDMAQGESLPGAGAGVSFYRAVGQLPQGKAAQSFASFNKLIDSMREATAHLPLKEIIDHVLTHSGLRAHYKAEREGQERLENLEELLNAAANFIQEDEDSLIAFLTHASLEAGDNQAEAGQDAVQMMSVHSSKGLEFNQVFITGLEEGLFPHDNSTKELDGIDEERRLMYVAITRARHRLYLSFSQQRMLHGQTRYNTKSQFLNEIPEQGLKWLTPRFGAVWAGDDDFKAEAKPAYAKLKTPGDTGWRIGQNVLHAKFGTGVIVDAEGSGQDGRLQVNFGRNGVKWLALAYAKLEKV